MEKLSYGQQVKNVSGAAGNTPNNGSALRTFWEQKTSESFGDCSTMRCPRKATDGVYVRVQGHNYWILSVKINPVKNNNINIF